MDELKKKEALMARLTREQSQALTREKLLKSAGDVVARYSYDGASVERISEEAGFSKGAFYSNFSSKEDILQQLLRSHAGRDVQDLTRLLENVTNPAEVVETVAQWSDARAGEQKWGLIAIEVLRRAQRDGTLLAEQRQLFVGQWEEVGQLLLKKLFPETKPQISALHLGGVVLELTYGGVAVFVKAPVSSGGMLRQVLTALRASALAANGALQPIT